MSNENKKEKETKNTGLMVERKKNKYINSYIKAMQNCEKSAWSLCKVVYETVKSNDFVEVFGTMSNYAKELNVSKASLSKYVKAYERRLLLLNENENNEAFSVSQIAEFSGVEMDETIDFMVLESVTVEDTTAEIREKAKHFLDVKNPQSEEQEETEAESEEVEEAENDLMIISYKGVEYQIISEEAKAKILEILEVEE